MDRVSKIACPETCPHHPFTRGNAEGLTVIEERFLKKVQKRMLDELGGDAARRLSHSLREAEDEVAEYLLLMQQVHAASETEGNDFFDRWQKAGFEGLNNDERNLATYLKSQRPALLQIGHVIDAWAMEVVDLLEPEPKTLTVVADVELDPAMEGDVLLGWIYDAPHFTRLSGPAFALDEHETLPPAEALADLAKSLGGPLLASQLGAWLRTHMLDVYASMLQADAGDDEDEETPSVDEVLASFDWSELPDFSKDELPRQRVIRDDGIEDRLAPFLHRYEDPEEAVEWFEETWQDIASGVDQLTEGVLTDEGFGVVLILLAKAAAVLHPRPPQRGNPESLRFVWQLGNELRQASRMTEEESFEDYVQDSPQPVVCEWLCGEATTFAEGDEAVFDQTSLAIVFPILKAAIWEMCHWSPA